MKDYLNEFEKPLINANSLIFYFCSVSLSIVMCLWLALYFKGFGVLLMGIIPAVHLKDLGNQIKNYFAKNNAEPSDCLLNGRIVLISSSVIAAFMLIGSKLIII